MDHIRKRLVHLHRCRYMTRHRLRKVISLDPTLEKIYRLYPKEISQLLSIPIQKASTLYKDLHNHYLQLRVKEDLKIYHVITIMDENYSPMLKTIKDPPFVLYGLGNISLLKKLPALSVIGTRMPTKEAKQKVNLIVSPLVKDGWVIISGMAKGIDSLAHYSSLRYHGETIAVLGGGFHYIYPKQNIELFRQISKTGLVLSEYSPNTSPKPYHFPERNRLISGLSFGTLVIEANEKSGTLITVDQALDQGREVYAVPGSPLIPQTKGCHKMIQDGAKLVTHSTDISEDWNMYADNWVNNHM